MTTPLTFLNLQPSESNCSKPDPPFPPVAWVVLTSPGLSGTGDDLRGNETSFPGQRELHGIPGFHLVQAKRRQCVA